VRTGNKGRASHRARREEVAGRTINSATCAPLPPELFANLTRWRGKGVRIWSSNHPFSWGHRLCGKDDHHYRP
jgi:hypothetical protein